MTLKRHRDAPFYFALARKFDPLNMRAIVGTGEAYSNSDSIDVGISYLEKELEKIGILIMIQSVIHPCLFWYFSTCFF
jgi:hypothetical protein